MMPVFWGSVAVRLVLAIETPLLWLRVATGALAGRAQKKDRRVVRLEIAVTEKEFDTILENPVVLQAFHEASMKKYLGMVPKCGTCGAAN